MSKKKEQRRTVEATNEWVRVVLIEDFDKHGVRTSRHRIVEFADVDTMLQPIWVRTTLLNDEQLWARTHRLASTVLGLQPFEGP